VKFPVSTGVWLVVAATIYVVSFLTDLFVYRFVDPVYIQAVWILVTALPLYVPMQKIVRFDPLWSKTK